MPFSPQWSLGSSICWIMHFIQNECKPCTIRLNAAVECFGLHSFPVHSVTKLMFVVLLDESNIYNELQWLRRYISIISDMSDSFPFLHWNGLKQKWDIPPVAQVLWQEREDWLVTLSFPKLISKKGEIWEIEIFQPCQESASFKTSERPQGLIDIWRTSV